MEFFGRDQRQHRTFEADHPAHAGVDEDEQRELRPVLTNAETMHPSSVGGASLFVQ